MNVDWSFFCGENAPFVKVLSYQHISYLAACGIIVALFIRKKAWVRAHTGTICRVLLWTLMFQQTVLLYGWYAVATGFDMAEALPLHISRVASLLTIVFLITKRIFFLDIVCYFSIFASVSLFYPMNVYHFAHASGISYMINHLITILMPVIGVIGFDWRPTWRSFRNAVIGFICYFPVALIANALIKGGNYFYQTKRPFLTELPAWQFAALTFIVTVAGFALAPLIYMLAAKCRVLKPVKQ